MVFLWVSPASSSCSPLQPFQWEGGVSYLQGRFASGGGLGWGSWGYLYPPCWLSCQSHTYTYCAAWSGGSHRAVPQGERQHQSCRAMQRKPTKFPLSNCFLWAQLVVSPLWFANKSDVFLCVFCFHLLFSAWLLSIHRGKKKVLF